MANISGDENDNTLVGTTGDDTITAGGGHDSVTGDAGDDTIDAGIGRDTVDAGAGNDTVHLVNDDDTAYGGLGDDTVYGGTGNDSIYGGDGADSLHGESENDHLDGGDGDDTIDAGAGSDTVYGGAGNDRIIGGNGSGADTDAFFGGDGDDTISVSYSNAYVDGGAGNDTVTLDGYDLTSKTIAFGAGSGTDTVTGWDPQYDHVYIGDTNPADIVISPTANPRIWELTIAGGDPADKLTLDWTFHWNTGMTESDIRARILDSGNYTPPAPACFTPGLRIETPAGPRPIGDLRAGDLVLTHDAGWQPVRAVIARRIGQAELRAQPKFVPVVIEADAFGPGLPRRKMHVSRQHGFLAHWQGAQHLVRAGHIAEELGQARLQTSRPNPVDYVHLALSGHALVRVEGVWTESLWRDPLYHAGRPVAGDRVRPLLTRRDLRRAPADLLRPNLPAPARAPADNDARPRVVFRAVMV